MSVFRRAIVYLREEFNLRRVVAITGLGLAATGLTILATRSGSAPSGSDRSSSVQSPLQPHSSRIAGIARSTCSCSHVAAQARVDAFAAVARRIYAQEHAAVIGRVVANHLDRNAALLRALITGDRAKIRSEARRPVIAHEVRVRVSDGSRVLMDAGLPFVVQGAQGELRSANGASLGRVDVSIQDVIGFVKLVDRETGTKVVVRGRRGIVQTQFPAAAHARLPASGNVSIRGRSYLVRSFHEVDFNGNPLTVWILDPA
jgi:hypothetical protein